MHAALWKLYRLRVRGSFRSIGRKVRSVRGALLAAFTLLIFGMMFGPNLVMAVKFGRAGVIGQGADSFGEFVSVGMFLYVVLSIVTSLGERAIYFSPSDVDMLFPAPFSRRQILLYKILGSVAGAVFVALIISASMIMHVRSWPAAAVGFFLAYLMMNSLTVCAQLIAQTVGERAFTRARKLLLGGVIVAVAAAVGQAASRGLDGSWGETLLRVRHSAAAEVVLAPFAVFAKIITAERLIPDALGWAALGAILVVGIYAVAIWLDANYLETAVRVSQQVQQRKRRMMSEGAFATNSKRAIRKLAAAPAALVRRHWARGLAAVGAIVSRRPRGNRAGRDHHVGGRAPIVIGAQPEQRTAQDSAAFRHRHRGLRHVPLLLSGPVRFSRRLRANGFPEIAADPAGGDGRRADAGGDDDSDAVGLAGFRRCRRVCAPCRGRTAGRGPVRPAF